MHAKWNEEPTLPKTQECGGLQSGPRHPCRFSSHGANSLRSGLYPAHVCICDAQHRTWHSVTNREKKGKNNNKKNPSDYGKTSEEISHIMDFMCLRRLAWKLLLNQKQKERKIKNDTKK